jgi:cardiolipin synthase
VTQWTGHYFLSHLLSVAATLTSLVMLVRILGSRRTPQSTFAWLLAIVFMPLVAIPLYLLLGSRKFPRKAKGVGAAREPTPPRAGNTFELLETGEAAYARLMDEIRGAKRSIDLTMFILGSDATGNAVVDALAERASKGVTVRVILDAVGCAGSHHHASRVLAAAGGSVRTFMPFGHSPLRGRTNLRSHRKLAVFDDVHVFAGGMNLANEYMGSTPDAARWRDIAAIASGRELAADATALFESDWAFCGGTPRRAADASNDAPEPVGDTVLQIVPSGPDMATDTVYDALLTAIFAARERISLLTPYYVPDDALQHALVLAARRGVLTEVVVPSRSNHGIADMARRAMLRELDAAGVRVRYYPQGMVHAKAMVVDDAFAYIGSPNFDMRSLFLNYEDALFVLSPGAIGQIRGFIDNLSRASIARPTEREHWVLEQVARLLAPEL